jgi:transposase
MMPHDLPPWYTVCYQRQRWLKAGVFAAVVQDLRAVVRLAQGRNAEPAAAMFDRRTVPATPASGTRAGSDGAQRRRGAPVHLAVDTMGHVWAAHVTAASAQQFVIVPFRATRVRRCYAATGPNTGK